MKLLVLASGNILQRNYNALAGGVLRFVGRTYDQETKSWVSTNVPEEVEDRAEYRTAVKEGDLLPADKATADYCGVKFGKQ